ncbi:uncharacterized protein M6B38_360920 [Iris pallida]|uniref:Uncharacterized protein n=1 Tax=Iris pallida TaxID=29817 RepID=A0AAX6GKK7_IRIPA|nr:uncharacterized protein M6B38_168845 [Iris pallida]KAJ6829286.1 uncharacterized protein M6B38_360920 [Iris pallida]
MTDHMFRIPRDFRTVIHRTWLLDGHDLSDHCTTPGNTPGKIPCHIILCVFRDFLQVL